MFQTQVPIGNMPINLVCLSNGTIAFVRVNNFKVLLDMAPSDDGVSAEFYEQDFCIDGQTYEYNKCYEYKQIPSMFSWLKQQRIQ